MAPRKKAQPIPEYHPVRFYKIIALSFLFLTVVLLAVIVFMSTRRATITIISKDDPTAVETTVTVGEQLSATSVAGTVTSTQVSLTKTYQPTGNKQEPGVATGIITIHNETSNAQPLVATTRFLTPDDVLFRLEEYTVVPANGSVQAAVYADQKGEVGNIGPVSLWTIPGLGASLRPVIYGSSDAPMTGGLRTIGILSEKDIQKAEDDLRISLKEMGVAVLQERFPEFDGVFDIQDIAIETDQDVGEEVSGFDMQGTATVAGILYDASQLENFAGNALAKHVIDDTEVAIASQQLPAVALDSVDLEDGSGALAVTYNGVLTLNPESKQLQKTMFFGMDKDEVRRYLLSLDHVYSVEVDFKPMWVRTIPYVPEHVTVVVKKVE